MLYFNMFQCLIEKDMISSITNSNSNHGGDLESTYPWFFISDEIFDNDFSKADVSDDMKEKKLCWQKAYWQA